ncbi:MAG: ATP-binding protein [Longimicrobiales bacterium]|nr:ATP-binding protein [Longimicrobiales bacterium]
MYKRWVEARVRRALSDTPVVLLVGPRRAGKTTLARSLQGDGLAYYTLDDPTTREFAAGDPVGFVRGLDRAILDEVQRAPDLLLAIKRAVDEDYRAGRFLLTGSANVMTLPRVADSLAGRMETVHLLPLARGEIIGGEPSFLSALFEGTLLSPARPLLGDALVEGVLTGGYPEAVARDTEERRRAWSRAYLESVLSRDLRDIADVERLTDFARFARLLALHSGHLVNYSQIGGAIGVSYKTAQRYVDLLEKIFLVATLPPWFSNRAKRLVKTPKLHFLDTGLLAGARGLASRGLRARREELGPILESFVYGEVLRLRTASPVHATPYHFRDHDGNEVDVVLERDDGALAGIEVKARASVTPTDFAGLRKLADASGGRFVQGVVLYDGDAVVPFGERLSAVPLSCLWG